MGVHVKLAALFSAGNANDYLAGIKENWEQLRTDGAITDPDLEVFFVPGFCVPCNKQVRFRVDYLAGGSRSTGPNWRERLVCPGCQLSNRQRLVATLVSQSVAGVQGGKRIYLMEQVTPLMRHLGKHLSDHELVGSEYFGVGYRPGQAIWPWNYRVPLDSGQGVRSIMFAARLTLRMLLNGGFRHEDIEQLSFGDGSLDIVVSNDVFEHVANPAQAFAECARVLKPGGVMIATFPYFSGTAESRTRARSGCDGIEHLLPPEYHGNPTSSGGSLVFTEFGGDVFDMFREAGFSDVQVSVFHEPELGHLGGGPVFILTR